MRLAIFIVKLFDNIQILYLYIMENALGETLLLHMKRKKATKMKQNTAHHGVFGKTQVAQHSNQT